MKEKLDNRKLKLTPYEIKFLTILLIITFLLHIFFYILSDRSDDDLTRFVERSNAALDGKISYKDEELRSDPKPFWTYFLALWLLFSRFIAGYLFNLKNPSSYDEEYTKALLIIINLTMVVVIFLAAKDMFSPKAAYFASCFYAINLFPLIICSVLGKYDVIPAFFVLIAVWMATKTRIHASALFLSIGTLFKYIAALPLPIILIFLWKKERNKRMIFNYFAIFSVTCFVIASPFLIIDAEIFIDSTLIFFLKRKKFGPRSGYHPYYHIPNQFLFLFPLIILALICVYALKKESLSNYDFVILLFMEISLVVFTNKSFLSQYFFYAIPYLALVFPNILFKEGKVHLSSENISLATSAIIISNLFTYNYLGYFTTLNLRNFNDFKLLDLFDYHTTYYYIGGIDGRVFIICFTLIIYLSLNYLLKCREA
ncbi:MAG: hypothetical protein ACETVN_00665 [Asgard group archaeon]